MASSQHGLAEFYAMYGDEDQLPEGEYSKTRLINEFDPTDFLRHYQVSWAIDRTDTIDKLIEACGKGPGSNDTYCRIRTLVEDPEADRTSALVSLGPDWQAFFESIGNQGLVDLWTYFNRAWPRSHPESKELTLNEKEIAALFVSPSPRNRARDQA
jgi:hypothetical protein